MKSLSSLVMMFVCVVVAAQSTSESPYIRTYGVKINVTDLEEAVDFYCNKLGFEMESRDKSSQAFLKTSDATKLVLNKVRLLAPYDKREARATLTFQVNDLDSTITQLRSKGVKIADDFVRKEAVGNALYMFDPFGNPISLMHQTIVPVPHFREPKIYNFGFFITDMDKMRQFYCETFGFVVRSERYLPLDLPLGHADQTFAFMLHYREGVRPVKFNFTDNERLVILFQTNDLDSAMGMLEERGVEFQQSKPVSSKLGRLISFYDPFGYLSELVEVKE